MIDHHPPTPGPDDRKFLLFQNRGEDKVRITYLRFQSCVYPRQWDTLGDEETLLKTDIYKLPIVGKGEIFIKWQTTSETRADHFTVQFDPRGEPYPYIFGGDRWTMVLRHAALRSMADGDTE